VLRCDVITLFPDLVEPVLGQGMLKQVPERILLEAAGVMLGSCANSTEFAGDKR